MTDGQDNEQQANQPDAWVIEPPGAGTIKVALGIGEGAELTREATEALEQLMGALHDEEVVGFSSFMKNPIGLELFGSTKLDLKCGTMTCSGENFCGDLECGSYTVDYKSSSWKLGK